MTAIQASHAGDPRFSPALSSHVERHRTDRGRLVGRPGRTEGSLPAAVGSIRVLAGVVLEWPIRSHRRSLRNAMLASTMLVERRIERDEVDTFLRNLDDERARVRAADEG